MDNEVNNLKKASHGYALDGRVVYRPVLDSKKLIHIGFAANYRTPNESLNEEDKNIFIYIITVSACKVNIYVLMWNETMLLRTMWHKEPTFSALGFYPEKLICTMNLLHVPVVRKEKVWRFVHDLTI